MSAFHDKLGVCGWSLQPTSPHGLVKQLLELGIPRLQCVLDPLRENPEVWQALPEICAQNNITLVSGMFTCVGEDYSTLETIRRTGGVVPDATWEQNWANLQSYVEIAARLQLKLVTFHAGFMPHDPADPDFARLTDRLRQMATLFAGRGIALALETGQETAVTLKGFLRHLNCGNVGVNFDPANLILYGKGDPVEALRELAPWVRQCHLKDATRATSAGTWGEEVPVGTGDVDWPGFFRALKEIKFHGHLCIEREAGAQRMKDIRAARQYVEALWQEAAR